MTESQTKTTQGKLVRVVSKTLCDEKIVVVYQKIKPEQGPEREQFNIYWFNVDGEVQMLERDAIIFWNQRKSIPKMDDDVSVFSLNSENPYEYDKVKDLYKVETVKLSNSEPPKK